jgi:hypothetical protein
MVEDCELDYRPAINCTDEPAYVPATWEKAAIVLLSVGFAGCGLATLVYAAVFAMTGHLGPHG